MGQIHVIKTILPPYPGAEVTYDWLAASPRQKKRTANDDGGCPPKGSEGTLPQYPNIWYQSNEFGSSLMVSGFAGMGTISSCSVQ